MNGRHCAAKYDIYMLLIIIIITSFGRTAARNERFSRIIFTGLSGDVVHYTAIAYIGNDSDLGLSRPGNVIL